MANVQGSKGLNFSGQFDVSEILANQQKVIKGFTELKKSAETSGGNAKTPTLSTKPLTEYQAGILKIKQEQADSAKQRQSQLDAEKKAINEKIAAEKSASIALQDAMRVEAVKRRELIALEKEQAKPQKRVTQVSNSAAEIGKYNAGTLGTNGQVNPAFTSYLREVKKDFDSGKISAQQYVAELERYSSVVTANTNVTRNQSSTNKQTALSKRELAEAAAMEALKEKEATAALKNHAREMSNAKGSLEQRRAALIRLTSAYDRLSQVERNTAAGMRLGNIVSGLSKQIGALELATNRGQRSVGQYGGAFSQLKEQLLGAVTGYFSLYAAINAGKAIFENNVHLSDDFTDVQRTAKLSGEEVDRLGEKLKNLNTRTSLGDLLDIGFEGGRLGVKKDEIFDYIKTVDQLAVVLKKELPGGAEAISESLGKVSKIYRIAEREGITLAQAMNKVGSSQLELAHDGGVTVKYLQDFSLGLAGTAVTAKLALPVIEGYGAVLSNSGQIASSASLALTRVVNDLSVKREKYFAIAQLADANLTLKEFTDLINNDTKGALDLFFKGLKAGNPVQTELADRLNSVGLKTGKVSNAVKVLAENQELLAKKIGIASNAYDQGTSVAHNFELANNSLSASLEKIKNSILNEFTDSSFSRSLAGLLNSLTDTRSEAQRLAEEYSNNKHQIEELESSLNPLVKRYDELKGKTKLNKEESEELRGVTSQIGLLLPGVTTAFDNYGNSIDINRKKIGELTQAQRDYLELQNRGAVNQAKLDFDISQKNLILAKQEALAAAKLDENKKNKRGFFSTFFGANGNGSNSTPSEIKENAQNARDAVTKLSGESYEAAKVIRDLGGVLTKAQQNVINFYEVINKPNKKKNPLAEITGTGEIVDDTSNTNKTPDKTPETLKAEIKSLTAANKKLAIGSKELADGVSKLKQLKKELKLALGGTDTESARAANQAETAAKKQKTLQEKLNEAGKKGKREELEGDRKELAEKTAYYENLRKLAKEHNDAVDKFNNDPKNKGKAKRLRVDAGVLLPGESATVNVLKDNIKADDLKKVIDKEKKYYEEFEKYKTDFGLEKAKKRYEKLINVDQTYLESLKSKQNALLGDDKAKGGDAGGGEFVAKQQKVLEEATAEALQEEQKRTDALLKEFMSYADKRKNLTEQFNADFVALESNPSAQAERKKKYDKDLKDLDDANATQLESYQKLFEGIDKLSTKSALQLVKTARKQLADQIKSGQIIDPAQIKLINALFDTTEQTIRSGAGQALTELARQVDDIASSIGGIDSAFGKVLNTLGGVLGQLGNVKKGFSDLKAAQGTGSVTGQLTAGLGIFGAGFNIFQSVVELFNKSAQREAQDSYARDLQNKQTEALNKALERQVALLNDVYGTDRIKDYSAAINQARENQAKYAADLAGKYVLTGNKELDDLITKINNGEQAQYGVLNSDIIKKNQAQFDALKLPSDIINLQRLLDEGKLDANTATIVQNLIKAKETAEQLVNNLRAENVGTTLEQIADDFISTLTDGVQDFGTTFEQTIQKSILNGFKGELIQKQLQAFYAQFATLSEDGLTSDEIETLRKTYLSASEQAKKDLEALSNATGIDLTSKDKKPSGISGAIQKTVTENTANEWIGLIRSGYDIQKNQLSVLISSEKNTGLVYRKILDNFNELVAINANTLRTANNTDLLNNKLDSIIKNTSQKSSSYDSGY